MANGKRQMAEDAAGHPAFAIAQVVSPAEVDAARALFRAYEKSLGISLCFQNFDRELASLPGDYAPAAGRLLLARSGERYAGCVALHALANDICEMKRLYVDAPFRGTGLGRALAEWIIAEARAIGYRKMRLDTIPSLMGTAVAMYRRLGFGEIPAYCVNPVEGAIYMELDL
jgi:GNAT superfamily N-acetyltransferase